MTKNTRNFLKCAEIFLLFIDSYIMKTDDQIFHELVYNVADCEIHRALTASATRCLDFGGLVIHGHWIYFAQNLQDIPLNLKYLENSQVSCTLRGHGTLSCSQQLLDYLILDLPGVDLAQS